MYVIPLTDRLDSDLSQLQLRVPSPIARDSNEGPSLVIDGGSLGELLNAGLEEPFLRLCSACRAVVCCRVTPYQKVRETLSEMSEGFRDEGRVWFEQRGLMVYVEMWFEL